MENGYVRPPEGPGLGMELHPDIRIRPGAVKKRATEKDVRFITCSDAGQYVNSRSLQLDVPEVELEKRRTAWAPPVHEMVGGYQQLYVDHLLQADQGADMDYLVGCRGAKIPRPSH